MKVHALLLVVLCAIPVLKVSAQARDNASTIQRFLLEAQTFYDTGRYALAHERYEKVLDLDPRNVLAINGEQKTEFVRQPRKKAGAEESGIRLRGDWIHPVATWEEPVPRRGLDIDPRRGARVQRAAGDEKDPAVAAIMRQLREIVVPKIEFRDTLRSDAIDFLLQEARRLDPEHRGYSVFLKLPAAKAADGSPAPEPRITLTATNLPLGEALRYVAAQVGMKVQVEPYAVTIVPLSERTDALVTAALMVEPSFFGVEAEEAPASAPAAAADLPAPVRRFDAKAWLETKGIIFPTGSSATYLLPSHKLVVRQTKENVDLIEKLLPVEEK